MMEDKEGSMRGGCGRQVTDGKDGWEAGKEKIQKKEISEGVIKHMSEMREGRLGEQERRNERERK